MKNVTLRRLSSSDQGTFGALFVGTERVAYTCEPPWRDNRPNRSCIPPGEYRCRWHRSPRYGWVYLVTGVPGRGQILMHPGNYGGDSALGLKTHTKGCILLGQRLGTLGRQRAVLVSRPTVRRFNERLNQAPYTLTILER